jgi:hypothetical protein
MNRYTYTIDDPVSFSTQVVFSCCRHLRTRLGIIHALFLTAMALHTGEVEVAVGAGGVAGVAAALQAQVIRTYQSAVLSAQSERSRQDLA